ncbi:MAG: hypothetical protein ACOY94_04460 [Bacillota bacterium]
MSVGGELDRLLESGDYWTCLAQGRDLLEQESLPDAEKARVLSVLCRCHLALGQFPGAEASGRRAAALAGRLGMRDLEGSALLDLAAALSGLRCHGEALDALARFREGLPEYTASQCLEGAALLQMGQAMAGMGRTAEAVEWCQRARHWFSRFGDERSAGECLLEMIEACLRAAEGLADRQPAESARWQAEAGRRLAETDRHLGAQLDDTRFTGRVLLARARYLGLAGQHQDAADEGFRALMLAEDGSRFQVEAQLFLSHIAEQMGRPVDSLNFAFAARVNAIDGRMYAREFEATSRLVRLIRLHGLEPLAELARELANQGVDLYQYIDLAEAERLTRGE